MNSSKGDTETWSALFAEVAHRNEPAVITDDGVWTAGDLAALAGGAADWLDEIGAAPGKPVAAMIASRPHSFSLALGGLSTNRPLAPLGPRLTERELTACLTPLGASVLVADEDVADHARSIGESMGLHVAIVPAFAPTGREISFEADPLSPAAILHTSGTSGIPKPVAYRQDRLALRTRVNGRILGFESGCIYATASPFHHIAGLGMLFVALGSGAAVLPLPRFTADAWGELIEKGVTHGLLVPSMIEQLLDEGRLEPGALRVLQYGASQIHPETLRQMFKALPGIDILQIYGQTEGSPITCLTPDDHRAATTGAENLLGSSGRAAEGVELRIDSPDADDIGEVHARARHFFKPSEDGWLHTGDLGRIDDAGYLHLSGRKGDMIIRGGENVYPQEVEQVLAEHPGVREVAVIGIPDQRLGENIRAYVVATDPASPPDPESLREHARASLAGFKVPVEWRFLEELPRNAAGKVVRARLVD
jgi:acyl-CoA synthetase (AMP-forming)/AMP-acid ligase II